jgi:hypothetical protein
MQMQRNLMKNLFSLICLTILFSSINVSAATENLKIKCTAEVSEILNTNERITKTAELDVIDESELYISLSIDLGGKNFSFSGNKKDNIFYVSITELPNYDQGALTTSAFSIDGRLQLSLVNKNVVHKLECFNR